jgi:Aspartyl protease
VSRYLGPASCPLQDRDTAIFRRLARCLIAIIATIFAFTNAAEAKPGGTDPTVSLDPYVGKLRTVRMEIGGRPVTMLFDTGAGHSLITPQLAAQIRCMPFGAVNGRRMTGEVVVFQRCPDASYRIGPISGRREFAVFDLSAILPAGLPPVDGVIGLDVFESRPVTITPGLSGLSFPDSRTIARLGPASRIRIAREGSGAGLTVFAPAATPSGTAWLLIDSGNLAGVKVHPWVSSAFGGLQQPPPAKASLLVQGAGSIELSASMVVPIIYDGALDASFLSNYAITLDLARSRVWWRRLG